MDGYLFFTSDDREFHVASLPYKPDFKFKGNVKVHKDSRRRPSDGWSIVVEKEENHKKVMMSRDTRSDMAMVFAAQEQPTMVEKPGCKICGRCGHEESICYEVIGYPPGWSTRGRGRGSRGARNNRGGRGAGRNRSYGRESAAAAIHQEEPHISGPAAASNSSAGTGPGSSERAHAGSSPADTPEPSPVQTHGAPAERGSNMLDNGESRDTGPGHTARVDEAPPAITHADPRAPLPRPTDDSGPHSSHPARSRQPPAHLDDYKTEKATAALIQP
ncbi:hypothetical protein Cgig2_004290 [Carnegiea gigantea]|uniref:Uncharacterized protein n=1 Tax=Carnegiea gigantea TaxID=171969 RepID=A0A9Q1GQI7_9CARY|nr:hypothetical protein Cgig2_004290 [Carnegiea gigantea]